jgi:hypothetical protein
MAITLAELKKARKKKSKYNAVRVVQREISFDSKLEASYYEHILMLERTKILSYHLRQVPFRLPGGVKYLVDFVLFYPCGRVRYVDVKGVLTQTSTIKIKQVQDLYPVTIELMTKQDMKTLGII